MSTERTRSQAEWVTFAASCAVLAVIVTSIGWQLTRPSTPAAPIARPAVEARHVGSQYLVDVVVTNEGSSTAANVQVVAELTVDGEATEADQTIDFLAGGEDHTLVFVFTDDPRQGELTVSVGGFAEP